MPTPSEENQKQQITRANERIAFMADRMAVLLVLLGQRHGGWEWLYGEDMWQNPEGIAEVLRDWPDYGVAKDIIRLWIRKHDA